MDCYFSMFRGRGQAKQIVRWFSGKDDSVTGSSLGSYYCCNFSVERSGQKVGAGFAEDIERSFTNPFAVSGKEHVSLAKSLACLPDESCSPGNRRKQRPRTRMELKRRIEMQVKKRVKAVESDGKFRCLMEKVIATEETLLDSYDILRLNSNLDLKTEARVADDICVASLVQQLRDGSFDIGSNTIPIYGRRKECLVLPNLNLRVIQEAIRVVLEVIYRPHFSKISHGCRSGRGRRSALMYVRRNIGKTDWWLTFPIKKNTTKNNSIMTELISTMGDKIADERFFFIIQSMFEFQVLNFEFGMFPKGEGLPQEGSLSPILMNIYLDSLDSEILRLSMRYEVGLGFSSNNSGNPTEDEKQSKSKLRDWFRRQIKTDGNKKKMEEENPGSRLHVCRYMDEIFIAVAGSEEIAISLKNDIQGYMKNTLHLQVDGRVVEANSLGAGTHFLGTIIRSSITGCGELRSVHKLKDKIRLFAAQKQDAWDAGMYRIGKKWLGYSLKKLKESEIKQLGRSTALLDKISTYRKPGMKTDHWFGSLLKTWMQAVNAKAQICEQSVLRKCVAEPALPRDLIDSFSNFQNQVHTYVSSETKLLSAAANQVQAEGDKKQSGRRVVRIEAPIESMQWKLLCYGLINGRGFPRHVSDLILHDDILILNWFSGLARRWIKWYIECDNFVELKLLMVRIIKASCVRTLAAKHRMHESLIEKRFEVELNDLPLTEDLEVDVLEGRRVMEEEEEEEDEGLMYGIKYGGLCALSVQRVVDGGSLRCFVVGCSVEAPCLYTLHVKEPRRSPRWNAGVFTTVHHHLSLNGERIGLCNRHVADLYLGRISLQNVLFGSFRR